MRTLRPFFVPEPFVAKEAGDGCRLERCRSYDAIGTEKRRPTMVSNRLSTRLACSDESESGTQENLAQS